MKSLFLTGKKPSEENYGDIFDSFVHKDDVEVVNNAVITAAITSYDTALKEVTAGDINTLGDVFQILSGFSTSDDVKALLNAAGGTPSWGQVTGKPSTRPVIWAEQVISLVNTPTSQQPANGYTAITTYSAVERNFTANGSKYVIVDIGFYNVAVLPYQSSQTSVVVSCLRSVTIAVDLKAAIL